MPSAARWHANEHTPGIRSGRPAARQPRGAEEARRRSLSPPLRRRARRSTRSSPSTASSAAEQLEAAQPRVRDRGSHSGDPQLRQGQLSCASPTAARACRSTSGRTRSRSATSRSSSCSISATGSASKGRLFRTRTNELTIWASKLEFLAKCLLPLPEKWHGLQDVEIRYRQRYLDLIVNPESRRVFEVRSRVITAIREFLIGRGFLEVETPMMQPIAGRRAGAAVRDASQRARHAALHAHRARALSEAADRRRHREGVRDQPQLPERRDLDAAQSRVHDARVLLGVRRLQRPDDADRGDAGDRRARGGAAADERDVQRPRHLVEGAVPAPVAARGGARGGVEAARQRRAGRRPSVARGGGGAGGDARRSRSRRRWARGRLRRKSSRRSAKRSSIQPTFVYDFPTEVSPLSKQKPDDPDTVERFELYIGGFEWPTPSAS